MTDEPKDRLSEGGVVLPPQPQDWKLRSKPELIRAFIERLPADDDEVLDTEQIEQAQAITRHLRDRAIEKLDLAGLRDVHTLNHELAIRFQTIRNRQARQRRFVDPTGAPIA